MARESKRARDERRFGKSDRFADWLMVNPIVADHDSVGEVIRGIISRSTVVDVSNVYSFLKTTCPEKQWDYAHDFPQCMPFRESVFAEYVTDQWKVGFAAQVNEPNMNLFGFSGFVVARNLGNITNSSAALMWMHMDIDRRTGASLDYGDEKVNQKIPDRLMFHAKNMLVAFLFAFTLANCKNTTVEPHEPNAKLNRIRSAAGLKPFLRYHTININPIRKVLKTEGGIETNGLKKALHICRGHFARYSEDKPLFGHTSGLVWRPAHTRGAIGQGVVVSDYKVNAPKS